MKHVFLEHARTHRAARFMFTDSSKDNNAVAYAVALESGHSRAERISSDASIFTAEMTAIERAVIEAQRSDNDQIVICSDS